MEVFWLFGNYDAYKWPSIQLMDSVVPANIIKFISMEFEEIILSFQMYQNVFHMFQQLLLNVKSLLRNYLDIKLKTNGCYRHYDITLKH